MPTVIGTLPLPRRRPITNCALTFGLNQLEHWEKASVQQLLKSRTMTEIHDNIVAMWGNRPRGRATAGKITASDTCCTGLRTSPFPMPTSYCCCDSREIAVNRPAATERVTEIHGRSFLAAGALFLRYRLVSNRSGPLGLAVGQILL